jgi:RNA polymerase sigma factor (sigma-70 family)
MSSADQRDDRDVRQWSDEELAAHFQATECSTTFEALWKRFQSSLRTTVHGLAKQFQLQEADAEDGCAQLNMVFLRLVKEFDPSRKCSFRTYAWKVCSRRALNWVRDCRPKHPREGIDRLERDLECRPDAQPGSGVWRRFIPGAGEEIERDEESAWLDRVAARLAADERRLLALRLAGWTLEEIAAELGLTIKKVRCRIRRQDERLRPLARREGRGWLGDKVTR